MFFLFRADIEAGQICVVRAELDTTAGLPAAFYPFGQSDKHVPGSVLVYLRSRYV